MTTNAEMLERAYEVKPCLSIARAEADIDWRLEAVADPRTALRSRA